MGLLGMFLAVVTGEIYRNLALENQRDVFSRLIQLKVEDILEQTIKYTSELGQTIQADNKFQQAIVKRDKGYIENHLDEQFHRYFVTLSVIKLEKLYAFDPQFNLVGQSKEGDPHSGTDHLPCPGIVSAARKREGAERLKILSELCLHDHKPYLTVLVPVGGVWFKGYLLAAVDPTLNFSDSENALGMPLTLTIPSEKVVYRSSDWPETATYKKIIVSNYTLNASHSGPVYNFAFAFNVEALYEKLENTRAIILIAASLATFVTALLSLVMLQKTVLNPLGALTHQLHMVRQDKTHLGERVKVTGNVEVAELAEDFNDMSGELHVLYKTLESMAFTDSLTGLPNRALFYDRLEQATYLTKRGDTEFILFMLDLDRFKYVNDTLGHHIGDKLLQEIAKRLQTTMRKSDTIARLGGDEFAAILSGVHSVESAEIIAKKIISLVSEPVIIDNHNLTVGASIGIVRSPQDGDDNNQLMQRADMAMYHAKNNRQGYTFYESNLDQHSFIQLNLENDLRTAIQKQQLQLYYQPKIDIKTGRICAVEALVRWQHASRGFLTPDHFIPLAEQTGLIHQLTQWVLNTALSQCARWHRDLIPIEVAVNLSARSLEDGQLVRSVSEALNHCGLEPQWLTLELTESAVMANPNKAMEMLTKLHRMGVKISVDDFGTGYSSLAYLKKLPVSDIKIDKSFVMDMNRDNNDAVIVRSTIDLAHNMGLGVIAEGVESKEVLDMLVKLGCDVAQGYYFCKPQDVDSIQDWLQHSRWGINARMKAV